MFPEELKRYGQSIVAVTTFASNIFFWRKTDYFAPSAEEQPLLHTWSLAVEEQFYLVFPLILIAFSGRSYRKMLLTTALIALGSLALSEFGWRDSPAANFYLLPTRAWELLFGALLALHHRQGLPLWLPENPVHRDAITCTGLIIIVFAVVFFDSNTPFPGLYAMLPVLGTVIIIHFGSSKGISGRILSSPPFVAVGLISYSVYLWHQPLLAFARIRSQNAPTPTLVLFLALLSVALGYLSWRYVERPFRRKVSRRSVFVLTPLSLVGLALLGLGAHVSEGHLFRHNDSNMALLNNVQQSVSAYCRFQNDIDNLGCRIGDKTAAPTFALWGDSHAGSISNTLGNEALRMGKAGLVYAYGGCPPVLGLARYGLPKEHFCPMFNSTVLENIIRTPTITTVILFARWTTYIEGGGPYDNGFGGKEHWPERTVRVGSAEREIRDDDLRLRFVEDQLSATIVQLVRAAKRVVLIKPVPEFGWNVPSYSLHGLRSPFSTAGLTLPSLPRWEVDRRTNLTYDILGAIANRHGAESIDSKGIICSAEDCVSGAGGQVWYADDDHLSDAGALRLLNHTNLMMLIRRSGEVAAVSVEGGGQ
jgi:peptidoglycan/LPS O-acetylase OafA/YrhL